MSASGNQKRTTLTASLTVRGVLQIRVQYTRTNTTDTSDFTLLCQSIKLDLNTKQHTHRRPAQFAALRICAPIQSRQRKSVGRVKSSYCGEQRIEKHVQVYGEPRDRQHNELPAGQESHCVTVLPPVAQVSSRLSRLRCWQTVQTHESALRSHDSLFLYIRHCLDHIGTKP